MRVEGGEIFLQCVTFVRFLKLIIPHWAQLWHCGGWHKSGDSCCWAGADPGESFPFSCGFFPPSPPPIHPRSHSPRLLPLTFYTYFANFLCISVPLNPPPPHVPRLFGPLRLAAKLS